MRIDYILRRIVIFVLIVWVAATLNFFAPRMTGKDPIRQKLIAQAQVGGYVQQGLEQMVQVYDHQFGLDQPLWKQYVTYLVQMSHFDLGYSITNYPKHVVDLMIVALPWTIGLLGMTTLIAFSLGSLLGALLTWPSAPGFIKYLLPPLLTFSAVPYYLLGLVLLYIFSFQTQLLPIFGGYTAGTIPTPTIGFWLDILKHSIFRRCRSFLPRLASGPWGCGP